MGSKDHTFDAPYFQDPLHKLLYAGRLFSGGVIVDSVANGASVKCIFNARETDLTLFLNWAFSGNGHVHFYNVSSWTGGTAMKVSANYTKFEGVNSISSELVLSPSSINAQNSTDLYAKFIPGGTNPQNIGQAGSMNEHIIVASGDMVLVELQNQSGSGATIGAGVLIHELVLDALDDPG